MLSEQQQIHLSSPYVPPSQMLCDPHSQLCLEAQTIGTAHFPKGGVIAKLYTPVGRSDKV
uniref:Uncharacterized protein n=1 Tax=Megaselia scalaris TaxID=36166 RepID=T1GIT9_MEGSC